MAVPAWNDKYLLGVDMIDRQHHHLFTTTRDLYNALMDGSSDEMMSAKRRALEYLDDYIRSHFLEEERFMLEISYPHLSEHRELHEKFASRVEGFRKDLDSGSLALTSALMMTLLEWFSDHFLVEDMKYVDFHRKNVVSPRREV